MSGRQQGWRLFIKRIMDRVAALVGLAVASPVLLVCAVGIRITTGTPVLFRQMRPGQFGRPFELVKFRTMRHATDQHGRMLPDAERLSRFGAFLRASSLDELPQLWNVWRGDISLVGPRPLLMQYLERYSPEQHRRHDVLPGITGYTQVNGRNALSRPEKFQHDVWYADHWSLWLDVKILSRTLTSVLSRKGISQAGHVTMPEFMGEDR
jgi:sugar transferase EpsL